MSSTINLDFKEPTIDDAKWAAPILYKSGSNLCEYSYTTLWMWRKYYNNQIARLGDSLFIRSGDVEPLYLIPAGGDLKSNIQILKDYQHQRGELLTIFGADPEIKEKIDEWFPGVFEWRPSEADFDYVYNTEDLALLKGRKYHSKRNHISSFGSRYKWSYERIDENNAQEAYKMVIDWCRERGNCSDPGLRNERLSIAEALKNMSELSLIGGLIRVENKVVAMTLGSPINDEVFNIHTEKALNDYSRAYAVINREFAANELLGKYSLINRENDMGIEGLRRAKKSYRPVQIIEKYLGTERV
jgi:hypothetical protein